jgi:hypothetical protein
VILPIKTRELGRLHVQVWLLEDHF